MSDVLRFRSPGNFGHRDCDMRELVLDICSSLASRLEAQHVMADVDIPFGERVSLDPLLLRQAIEQLVHHALDAMPSGGELSFSSCNAPGCYELEVADTGPGLSRDAKREMLSLASTSPVSAYPVSAYPVSAYPVSPSPTRISAKTFSSVADLVARHGCELRAANCAQGGAAVTLRIPRQAMRAAA